MDTHSDSGKVRDRFQFPGSQATDLRISLFFFKPWIQKALLTWIQKYTTLLYMQKYQLWPMFFNYVENTYAQQNGGEMKQNEQKQNTEEREEWIS